MKKTIAFFLCIYMTLNLLLPGARAAEAPGVSAESYLLLEAATGTVLASKRPDEQMLIASTTKIMTGAIVAERCDLDELVTVKPECTGIEGSSMYLKPGEELTVEDLLYGLMLASGNDAAAALAYHVAGGIEEFARLMNEKAKELGMENSHFVNPHGLNAEGHYATARDLAVLTAWAMELESFARVVGTRGIQAAGRSLSNHNKLLWRRPDVLGVKTGFTKLAGRSLVSCAEREGTRLICVTLSAPDDWDDHEALLDWGFQQRKYHKIIAQGEVIAEIPVIAGTEERVALIAEGDIAFLTAVEDQVDVSVRAAKFAYAAVRKGERGGSVSVEINGEAMYETPLLYKRTVERDETNRLRFLEQLKWHWDMANC